MSVERLDRRIDVENIFLGQQRMRALIDVPLQPLQAPLLIDPFCRAARGILLTILRIPSNSGSTPSLLSAVMCA